MNHIWAFDKQVQYMKTFASVFHFLREKDTADTFTKHTEDSVTTPRS